MIKLIIADDHKIVLDGLNSLFYKNKKIKIAGEAMNGQEVLDLLKKKKADMVLMDINMPVMDGIEATKRITEEYPDVKVIAMTMHQEESYITKMLKVGAKGYVLKSARKAALVEAIEQVCLGESYFSSDVSKVLMSKFMVNPPVETTGEFQIGAADLTVREKEIVQLVLQEYTNKEIAEELLISLRTVDTHRRNLMQKIGVKNTAGIVKFGLTIGLR